MTRRVTHLAIVHRARDTRIFRKQCRALAAAGYEVNYVAAGPPPSDMGGVRVHSITDDPRPRARQQLRLYIHVGRWARRLWPCVYHLHEPHLIPLGLALKAAGARVVYDVHEDNPGHARSKLFAHPLRGRAKGLIWHALEVLARRWFDAFSCASPVLAGRFPPSRTAVVGNFPLHREFDVRPYRERPRRIVYTGVIREIRGFWEMARALELLPREIDCRLRLIGTCRPPDLFDLEPIPASDRIELVPWQPYTTMVRELLEARVGLVLLHPLPNHDDAIRSNKLFEYMAAGVPVVASDLPRWREIVHGVGCGLVVDPLDPTAIAGAIRQLLCDPDEAEAMGLRGRAAVETTFNWDAEGQRLLALYGRLAGPNGAPARAAPVPERAPSR